MDPVDNPFAPGAGTRPPALVGRDSEIQRLRTFLLRFRAGKPGGHLMVTGVRGVGKTVLLSQFEDTAAELAWQFVAHEVARGDDFRARLSTLCSRALVRISPPGRLSAVADRAARVLRSFRVTYDVEGSISIGMGEPEPGRADSGSLEDDVIDLLEALALAAQEQDTGVVLAIDEIQDLESSDVEALVGAVHRVANQQSLPISLVAAGLPNVKPLVIGLKPYAERMFSFADLGPLSDADVAEALRRALDPEDVHISDEAVARICELSEGYPYFVQMYGEAAWNEAESEIDLRVIEDVQERVERSLDAGFFEARLSIATEREIAFLYALAEIGDSRLDPTSVADVFNTDEVTVLVDACASKHFLFTGADGTCVFTAPQFARFLRRRRARS